MAKILMIDDSGTRKHSTQLIGVQRVLDLPPVNQIVADRMPPPHLSPGWRLNIVLEKEVPDTVMVHEPVRIVDPVFAGREVKLRPV